MTFSRLAVFALISFNAACAVKNIRRLRLILNAAIVCAGIFLLMPCAFAGRFLTATKFPVGGVFPDYIAAADLNGDGNVDLVVANFGTPSHKGTTIAVLLSKGDGTFQKAVPYPSGGAEPVAIAVGDFNGDGKPDLAVSNRCAPFDCNAQSLGILINNGDGTFPAGSTYPVSGAFVATGDFNGDGKLDLAVGFGNLVIMLGNGDGTFTQSVTYSILFEFTSIVVADFNADGKLDIAGSGNVLLGNGDGTFHQVASYSGGGDLAVADFNNDGKLDLANPAG